MKRLMWSLTMLGGLWLAASVPAQTLELLDTVALPGTPCEVSVVDSLAYVACFTAGLQVVQISDPEHLALLGGVDTPLHARDVLAFPPRVYVADQTSFRSYSLADPASPVLIDSIADPQYNWIWELGRGERYLTVLNTDSRLLIIDPAPPAGMQLAGSIPGIGYT